jgi:hypothetical protein
MKFLLLLTLMLFGSLQAADQAAADAQDVADALDQQEVAADNPGAAAERRAAVDRKSQMAVANKSNMEKINKAFAEKKLSTVLAFYHALEDMQDRDITLARIIDTFDPTQCSLTERELLQKHLQKLKSETNELPQFHDPERVALWKPYLLKVFPAEVVPLDVGEKFEKDAKATGPVMKQTEEANRQVVLKSKDGQQFVIDRLLATHDRYSDLISTVFLNDPDAHEMNLDLSGKVLEQLLQGIKVLAQIGLDRDSKVVGEAYNVSVIGLVKKLHPPVANRFLPELIKGANYIGSKFLLGYYLDRYVAYLHQLKQGPGIKDPQIVTKELTHQNFPLELIRLIAEEYFLQTEEGLDRDVESFFVKTEKDEKAQPQPIASASGGVAASPAKTVAKQAKGKFIVPIPLERLVGRGFIPASLLKSFPNLETNPNEIRDLGNVYGNRPALTLAVERAEQFGGAKTVKALLRLRGIDINIADPVIPVFQALYEPEILRVLVDAGADIKTRNQEGNSLMNVVFSKNAPDFDQSVQILIDAGAELEGNGETTFLMQALRDARFEIAQILIKAGANVNAFDADGNTVWSIVQYARSSPSFIKHSKDVIEEIKQMLRKAGVKEVINVSAKAGAAGIKK